MKNRSTKNRLPPFLPLLVDMLDAPATKALSHGAFRLYVALKRECNQSISDRRNGRVYLSQRRAHQEIRSKREQIARWYREFEFYGFIVMTERGCLGLDGKGKAPRWRLTELGYMNDPPTKDFLRWRGAKFRDQKIQKPGPETGATLDPKTGPPKARSGPENGAKGKAGSGPENGSKLSLTTGMGPIVSQRLEAGRDDRHGTPPRGSGTMNRHERRSDLARYRRETSGALLTYLVEPNDAALTEVPILHNAARSWLDALSVRARACIICSEWLWSRQGVGLLLLSTPSVVRPTAASVCGICTACAELPLPALEQAASNALQAAVPGGRFEPMETRR